MAEATAPARDAGPNAPAGRPGWLTEAEADTGFTLGQRVMVKGSNHGVLSIVGFAQIDAPGIDGPIRCIVVADPAHLTEQGPETCILYTPDRLKPAPNPA